MNDELPVLEVGEIARFHRLTGAAETPGAALAHAVTLLEQIERLGVSHPSIEIEHRWYVPTDDDTQEAESGYAVSVWGDEDE